MTETQDSAGSAAAAVRTPTEVLDSSVRLAFGELFYSLIVNREWRLRQVETVVASEDRRYQRRISFDCEIAGDVRKAATRLQLAGLPVPLILLRKKVLLALDVEDASGRSVPVATRTQNGALALAAVESEVARICGSPIPEDVKKAVRDLIMLNIGSSNEIKDRLQAFDSAFTSAAQDSMTESVAQLWWFLDRLADHFVFAVVLPVSELNMRQILKISYETDDLAVPDRAGVGSRRRLLRAVGEQLGLRNVTYEISPTQAGASDSYHFEFRAPLGLDLCEMNIIPEAKDDDSFADRDVSSRIGHLVAVLPRDGEGSDAESPEVSIHTALMPSLDGLVLQALLSSAVAAMALTAGMLFLKHFTHAPSDPAVALLQYQDWFPRS